MNKEKNKSFTIKFKPSLMEQVEHYIKLVNSTKTAKEPKLTKATFFNRVVTNYFQHTVLTNDFITLDRPLYFNSKELVEKGSIKCSNKKPTDLDNVFIVKRVPNNLVNLEKGFLDSISYYYDRHYQHKGIVFSAIQLSEDKSLEPKYLVFDYNEFNADETEVIISILKPEDLTTYLDIENDKELILNLKKVVDSFEKDLKEAVDFYSENKEILKNKNSVDEIPNELVIKFSKIGFKTVQYYCYNFNCFIPLRFYSKLQQLLIFLNNATTEEINKIEDEFGISKTDLEVYIDTFKLDDNYKFNLFFMKIILNEYSLDFNKLVNGFLNEEEFSILFKNYFFNEKE